MAFDGTGFGRVVAGLELVALELTGVDAPARGDVAAVPGVEHARRDRAHTSGSPRRSRRRHRPRGAAASSGRRRSRSRTRPGSAATTAAVAPGFPAASLSATMFGTSLASRTMRVAGDLAAGAHRDVVEHHRQVGRRRRSPGSAPRSRPATDGCRTGTRRGCRRRRGGPPPRSAPMSWRVFEPVVPATTGTVTALTTASNSCSFSSIDRVGDSPVVPETTRPSLPCSTSHFAERDCRVDVELAVVVERRDHCGEDPAEHGPSALHRHGGRTFGRFSGSISTARNLFDVRRSHPFDWRRRRRRAHDRQAQFRRQPGSDSRLRTTGERHDGDSDRRRSGRAVERDRWQRTAHRAGDRHRSGRHTAADPDDERRDHEDQRERARARCGRTPHRGRTG